MPRQKKPLKGKRLTAKQADKHTLYQLSVQAPEEDSKFFARLFKRLAGRPLRLFREDFCGTAILSCHHVRNHKKNRALCVDIHAPTLAWAEEHNVAALPATARERVSLVCADVLDVKRPRADLTAALNFSYSCFKDRKSLLKYVKRAYAGLAGDGVFVMDAWGGSDTQLEQVEEREIDEQGHRFTYCWDQHRFDPVSYETTCKIHFEFGDGSRMENAFVYDWRLWTLPELRELMTEAGFEDVHVLWEGTDTETDEGNGVFRRVRRGEADAAWIAYVVGCKRQ